MVEIKLTGGRGVLLKRGMEPLLDVAEEATINCSPEGLLLTASDTSHSVIAALRIKSYDFTFFRCVENISSRVNLGDLYQNLSFAGDDDNITIYCDDGVMMIGFVFEDPRTLRITYSEVAMTQVKDEHVQIDELQYEYEVVVGIPSEKFRHIIMHLGSCGETVSVTVTGTQVKFSTENEEIALSKENGECIIGGAADDNPVHLLTLLFSVDHMTSFVNASLQSNRVWILQSKTSPTLLNCPVKAFGNIMFYFV